MNIHRTHRRPLRANALASHNPPVRAVFRPMLLVLLVAAAIASCDGLGGARADAMSTPAVENAPAAASY